VPDEVSFVPVSDPFPPPELSDSSIERSEVAEKASNAENYDPSAPKGIVTGLAAGAVLWSVVIIVVVF
jgi:hypothetical protein